MHVVEGMVSVQRDFWGSMRIIVRVLIGMLLQNVHSVLMLNGGNTITLNFYIFYVTVKWKKIQEEIYKSVSEGGFQSEKGEIFFVWEGGGRRKKRKKKERKKKKICAYIRKYKDFFF